MQRRVARCLERLLFPALMPSGFRKVYIYTIGITEACAPTVLSLASLLLNLMFSTSMVPANLSSTIWRLPLFCYVREVTSQLDSLGIPQLLPLPR